jgi:hypothetical protein
MTLRLAAAGIVTLRSDPKIRPEDMQEAWHATAAEEGEAPCPALTLCGLGRFV